jgi:hypothetical protein
MSKAVSRGPRDIDKDTMRPEYDFSDAVRGLTPAVFVRGAHVVVIEPELHDVFPNSASVLEVLHALAPILRRQRATRTRKQATVPRSRTPKEGA